MGHGQKPKRAWAVGAVQCPVCGWRFPRDRSLQDHLVRFHPDYSPQSSHGLPYAQSGGADARPAPARPLSLGWRVVAGIGAFLWIPVMVLAIIGFASVEPGQEEAPALATIVGILFIPAWATAFAAIVLMLRHVYTETDLSIGWKTAWTAFLALFNVFAAPVYFLRHMVKGSPHGQEQASRPRPDDPEETARAALDALAAELSKAREVPLTRSVRLDPNDVAGLVGEIRALARNAGEERRAEQLHQLILAGPRVPFTDQVRVDRRKALRLIEDLRSALGSRGG